MHSNLKKGLFLVTFLGMTVSPGISVMAADGDTAEAAKMPGVGIEAVLKDFYSQNREIKAEDYLVPENKGEYLDMAFANVTSFLYVRSEPTKESEYVGKLYPGYAAKITGPVGEWTKVESGNVTGYVYSRYITVGNEAQKKAEELVQNNDTGNAEDAFTYAESREEEAARLSAHFRSKVDEARRNARDSAGMISFYQIMKETLDYRKWFEFQLFSQKSGERQELTNSVFGTFSGGEKAMSMYVPLFSAVVAKYQGGRADAPRLISLDEAFAGVDNRNIRDMFRLMTQFEFDFIINSQVLWGDCDTLDALAIYQLIRPENAKFVTVMPYLWNGHSKELLDDEEKVEQRGIEIEQFDRA